MILLVGSEKGGTGKTTLATNLAVMRAIAGRDVLLVDADRQGSASAWSATRNEYALDPVISCAVIVGRSTGHEIIKLREKFDDIIVDAGGRDSVELRSCMVIADVMLTPVRPGQFDVWTFNTTDQLIHDARARGNETLTPIAVINAANPNPILRETASAIELINEYETFKSASTVIHERIAFRHAAREGCGVVELVEGDTRKATQELNNLYAEIFNEQATQKTATKR